MYVGNYCFNTFINEFIEYTLFFNFCRQFMIAFYNSIDKWLMRHKRVDPFLLLFCQGIAGA